MIGYLEGTIMKCQDEGILLLAGNVGYDISLSSQILNEFKTKTSTDKVSLYIYYHQTERQPKPVLIGFRTEEEKAFFQLFISVDAIGPLKALKAIERPIGEIALAIENSDVKTLSTLKGIGKRTAQKIIATLQGKAAGFLDSTVATPEQGGFPDDVNNEKSLAVRAVSIQVIDVLVGQLGHSLAEAKRLVDLALARNPGIRTPEALFDEIYKQVDQ